MPKKRFICDFCNEIIRANELAEVGSVNHNCENTGEFLKYFHLSNDKSSKYSEHYGRMGCYQEWRNSKDCFRPHSIRKVSKSQISQNPDGFYTL